MNTLAAFRRLAPISLLAAVGCLASLGLWVSAEPLGPAAASSAAKVNEYGLMILSERPHDPKAFTQGLVYDNGLFLESTGLYQESTVREVDPWTGGVLRQTQLADSQFGEGLALVGDRLIQITWREKVAHVYDRKTLEKKGEFHYEGEGWGLAYDGVNLVMTDGSDRITFRNPDTFDVVTSIGVTLRGKPVGFLNELEIPPGGSIFANVLGQDTILEIDPKSGNVRGIVDASNLLPPGQRNQQQVLNGIAYDANAETFFLTGKNWPTLYEVQLVPKN